MKDLTQGSITKNILTMAAPVAAGMVFQALYLLVDLYFVSALGDASIAGVGAAGTIFFIVMAMSQVLGVSSVALISHAVGRKDRTEANLVFNQSLVLAALCSGVTLILGYSLAGRYMDVIAAGPARGEGVTFLHWFLPGVALQFALMGMGSALRGTGIVKPTMIVQILTVILNTILAPVLIAGWGTGVSLGVMGAGLASSISVTVGVVLLTLYFIKLEKYVSFQKSLWWPKLDLWGRMFNIGLPAGGEMMLMFIYTAIVYWVIQGFGAPAQAGFSIGARIMQAIFMPTMAIAFAVGPIAGQNFGAHLGGRVKETYYRGILLSSIVMLTVTMLLQWRPELILGFFTGEADVINVGAGFLHIISLNFVAQGIVFSSSGMFQGLGNTRPSMLSSGFRLLVFVPIVIYLRQQPGFYIYQVWYVSVLSVTLQACVSYLLVRRQFQIKLKGLENKPETNTEIVMELE